MEMIIRVMMWDAFFPVMLVSAFSMPLKMQLGQRYVVADFPATDIKKGLMFIHSPEYWANGMSLSLGVPRFRMRHVSPVVFVGEDKLITFYARGEQVALMSTRKEQVTIKVGNHTDIKLKVQEYEWTPGGFSLLVDIKSTWLTNETRDWDQCARKFLEVSLFALLNNEDVSDSEDELHLRMGNHFLDAYRSLVFGSERFLELDD